MASRRMPRRRTQLAKILMAKAGRTAKADAMARQVQEALRPGQSVELLKELHILTREGALNQDSRRKLKQVYHLFGFIEKILLQLESAGHADITLADHGAGKSYLGSSQKTENKAR